MLQFITWLTNMLSQQKPGGKKASGIGSIFQSGANAHRMFKGHMQTHHSDHIGGSGPTIRHKQRQC